ncbi:MAG: ABC transporter substrate-binding protein [Eubacteriales bacterium]|nr:ABC transporter substrate-binding protein [Eubacteriales bacterium]MDD4541315.1 ABC transporter substrate-binding protein [Eubacteriales bacterium]
MPDIPTVNDDLIVPSISPGTEEPMSRLRLRYHDEGNLNPLLKHSYNTQAIFTLIYDSLFAFDSSGSLRTNLADSALLSDDQLLWTISLKNLNFHTGDKLTATDVEASLRFWLDVNINHRPADWNEVEAPDPTSTEDDTETENETDPTDEVDGETSSSDPVETSEADPPEVVTDETTVETTKTDSSAEFDYYIDTPTLGESAQIDLYSGTLRQSLGRGRLIEAIGSIGTDEVVIKLKEVAPILDLLTFPIIPAEYIYDDSYRIIPGTGVYRIKEREANGNLLLQSQTAEASRINEILAVNCSDVMEALDLFESGNLDILLLQREETSRLKERSRVRSQDYRDSGFVSLYVPDNALRVQIETTILEGSADLLSAPFPHSPYYIRPGDYRILDQNELIVEPEVTPSATASTIPDTSPPETDPEGTAETEEENLPICRVLMPRVFYPLGLHKQLSSIIAQCGAKAEYIMVAADEYGEQLKDQQYDLALLLDESASFGDPLDYALGLLNQNLINEINFTGTQIAILEAARLSQSMVIEEHGYDDARYQQTIHDLFSELPVIGLCTTSTLLWYANGVEGTLSGTAELPYEGVESIRVWQR